MRAALYARVSTEEQVEGYSLGAQRRAFGGLVTDRDWTTYREYVEEGRSAHTDDISKRPVFKQAIEDALAGRYDVLVVHKIDRFSRKLKVTLEYFEKLGRAGVGFISIENQIDYSTPTGKFMLVMQGGLAELYSDNLSQEVKKGWAERRAQGLYCGLLPFGAAKGEDGVPVPDPETFPGIVMAFELSSRGRSNRDIAQSLNEHGYRTAGNQGNRPFTKETVRGVLANRFYLGEIPDGTGGWQQGRHAPMIDSDLFEAAQQTRLRNIHRPRTINQSARTYSLSCLMRSRKCGSSIRMQMSPKGKPRVYCSGRVDGLGCTCKGTFLDVYEEQVRWYLEHFVIPGDYQERILDSHEALDEADEGDSKRKMLALNTRLQRLQEMYEWGHKNREQYLREYESVKAEIARMTPSDERGRELERLAEFLGSVAAAWDAATQEQRNKLARSLFEEIWSEDATVAAVKPRPELEPFFRLNLECQSRDIAGDPDRIRTGDLCLDRAVC